MAQVRRRRPVARADAQPAARAARRCSSTSRAHRCACATSTHDDDALRARRAAPRTRAIEDGERARRHARPHAHRRRAASPIARCAIAARSAAASPRRSRRRLADDDARARRGDRADRRRPASGAMPPDGLHRGAFTTALAARRDPDRRVRIPKLSAGARWSYYKFCRKPGEFAEAIAAVLRRPGARRLPRRDRRAPTARRT